MGDQTTTSYWLQFFLDAGIPPSDAENYAVTFSENRIKAEMLTDLSKDILNDMGIKLMGDVIAILKHAREEVSEANRSKALKGVSVKTQSVGLKTQSKSPLQMGRLSSGASRTLTHYLKKAVESHEEDTPSPKPEISSSLAARLGPKNVPSVSGSKLSQVIKLKGTTQKLEVPVPKMRRVLPEHEGKYKVTLPQGTTPRTKKILQGQTGQGLRSSSVFDRLGSNLEEDNDDTVIRRSASGRVTITGLDNIQIKRTLASTQTVQRTLGKSQALKRPASTSVTDAMDEDDDSVVTPTQTLPYQGILKLSSAKRRALQEEKKKEAQKKRLEEMKKGVLIRKAQAAKKVTSGILSPDAVDVKVPVVARLGQQTAVKAEAQSTTSLFANNKVKPSPVQTSSGGVFSRLGKKI